jgi:hypothetical protein
MNITDAFIEDLLRRKEFYELKIPHEIKKKDEIDELIREVGILKLRSHQTFVRRFMTVFGPGRRLYIKHAPGTGKTLEALSLAKDFLQVYKTMYDMGEKKPGNVIVIGFNIKPIFYRELLRFAEFGFINEQEIIKYNKLRELANLGGAAEEIEFKEFRSNIIRRLYRGKFGGFFRFYGYKELVNRLFSTATTEKKEINIKDLSDEQIAQHVKEGKLIVNVELFQEFENAIMICDEIHHAYNSVEKNNYGMAIQTILNSVKSLKAIFMSATPLNNSPTEFVDLQNFLLEPEQAVKRDDFFTSEGRLKPNTLSKIRELMRGKVSFFRDDNPAYFPKIIYEGIPLKTNEIEGYKQVPYLKFIKCPMTKIHERTYRKNYRGVLSIEDSTLDDMVLPNPESTEFGLFNSMEIREKIANASQKWKDKNQIDYNGNALVGNFFNIENIKDWSSKLDYLHNLIMKIVKSKELSGKILIYHPKVSLTGVMMIDEFMKRNNLPDNKSEAFDNTPCSICGVERINHDIHMKKVDDSELHGYMPIRWIMAHGSIDKNVMTQERNRFNSPDNSSGHHLYITIGSNVILEGYDYKELRHIICLTHTVNISELIQLIGRGARHGSHERLSVDKHDLRIYLLTSTLEGEVSHEEHRYIKKMIDHLEIQKIEREMHAMAIDSDIHYETTSTDTDDLISLRFKPGYKVPNYKLDELKLSYFYAFHANDEVRLIKYIIKRLFITVDRVWDYKTLWEAVKDPEFDIQTNSRLFLESSFTIALSQLAWDHGSHHIMEDKGDNPDDTDMVKSLFSDSKEIITENYQKSVIVQMRDIYILFPIIDGKPSFDVESCYRDFIPIPEKRIGLKSYVVENDNMYDYTHNKIRFHARYNGVSINRLTLSICEYKQSFHIQFLEDAIQYAFKIWAMPGSVTLSEYHEFYFRMLYFYTSLELVIYANSIQDLEVHEKYTPYVISSTQNTPIKLKTLDKKSVLALLESSLKNKSNVVGCIDSPQLDEQKIVTLSKESQEHHDQYTGKKGKKISIVPVDSSILPIGHILGEVPRMYEPRDISDSKSEEIWTNNPEYLSRMKFEYKENNIIIGYYEKSKTGIEVRFKLRKPIQFIKIHTDTRMIERGSVCTSIKKPELFQLCEKLGIKDPCIGIKDVCNVIRVKLIENEIEERRKGTNIKWFYHLIEKQPIPGFE